MVVGQHLYPIYFDLISIYSGTNNNNGRLLFDVQTSTLGHILRQRKIPADQRPSIEQYKQPQQYNLLRHTYEEGI
eukprot:UN12751